MDSHLAFMHQYLDLQASLAYIWFLVLFDLYIAVFFVLMMFGCREVCARAILFSQLWLAYGA